MQAFISNKFPIEKDQQFRQAPFQIVLNQGYELRPHNSYYVNLMARLCMKRLGPVYSRIRTGP